MRKLIISSTFQLISIPIVYWTIYGIAIIFHPRKPEPRGIDFYPFLLLYLGGFLSITIPLLNWIFTYIVLNNKVSIIAHVCWFTFIIWMTKNDLLYRPYDYGLIAFAIGTTLLSRPIFNKIIKKY